MKTPCFVLVAAAASIGALCGCSSKQSAAAQGQQGAKDSGSGQNEGPCGSLPPVDDYSIPGPFPDTVTTEGSGPDGNYTLIAPANLGALDGKDFKHPIITWGNGITTTPKLYPGLLSGIASHGFV